MTALPKHLLGSLRQALASSTGLDFSRESATDFTRRLTTAAKANGENDIEIYVRQLLASRFSRRYIEELANHLTVGETYFFREPASFRALEQHVLPGLLQGRQAERKLRIWSAGCCTGEEAYSIAILLDRLIPHQNDWDITVLATDINPHFLARAAEGIYGEWSFRGVPSWIRERYFTPRNHGRFQVTEKIRERVTFSYLNLAEDSYPSPSGDTAAMDIILCRNVLMYFAQAQIDSVIERFHRCLADGGWLFVSPAETSIRPFPGFVQNIFADAILYRKSAQHAEALLPHARPAAGRLADAVVNVWKDRSAAKHRSNSSVRRVGRPVDSPPTVGTDILIDAARVSANAGRLAEAAERCDQAIASDKLSAASHYLSALIALERGQSSRAVQSLTRALYLDPAFVLAHFALGNVQLSRGRRAEADRHFLNALVLLEGRPRDDVLPESDGLTVGRLSEIIVALCAGLSEMNG